LTISIWTLSAEELLYELSNLNILIILVIIFALINIYFKSKFLNKILFLLIVLKLFIPFSTFISSYADKYIFQPKISKIEKQLKPLIIKQIHINKPQNEGFLTKIKNALTNSSQNLNEIKQYTKFYISHASEIIGAIINLGAIYLSKLILNILLLPFIFIYLIKNIKLE
jgi:hypothetical protein